MSTKVKPALLSSAFLRNSDSKNPLVAEMADFIDGLSRHYDALQTLHKTVDPTITKSGHALKVGHAVKKTLENSGQRAIRLSEKVADYEKNLRLSAQKNAGLFDSFPESHLSELRSALRQMTPKERNDAIRQAFKTNDVAVIRAVREASSSVLVGTHSVPFDSLLEQYIYEKNPQLRDEIDEINSLNHRLDLVSDTFVKNVSALRDIELEEQAEQEKAATDQALASLDLTAR